MGLGEKKRKTPGGKSHLKKTKRLLAFLHPVCSVSTYYQIQNVLPQPTHPPTYPPISNHQRTHPNPHTHKRANKTRQGRRVRLVYSAEPAEPAAMTIQNRHASHCCLSSLALFLSLLRLSTQRCIGRQTGRQAGRQTHAKIHVGMLHGTRAWSVVFSVYFLSSLTPALLLSRLSHIQSKISYPGLIPLPSALPSPSSSNRQQSKRRDNKKNAPSATLPYLCSV
ncbi:hypothetical protein BKA80DRAFT_86676 [Phyllosticta citrichinensis]